MAGMTSSGLTIRTQPEIQALLEAAVDGEFPGLNIRAGIVQQLIGVMSEELALAWEVLQAVYSAAYPDSASGVLLDQVAALTGTRRRQATRSRALVSLSLNASVTVPAGSIVAVLGDPDSQFQTTAAATNASASPAAVEVAVEGVLTGPVAAPAGSLSVIVTPVAGWTASTNPAAAALGKLVALDAELRTQRVIELSGSGAGTLASLRAAVARVALVEEVSVIENATLSTDADGRPGKGFEVVLWDSVVPAALDDEIAQAIYDHKPAGVLSYGADSSGVATTDSGLPVGVNFSRAAVVEAHVSAVLVLAPGTPGGVFALAQAAVEARGVLYTVGQTAYASQLICALLEVPGVVAVTSLTIGTAPAPVTSSVIPTVRQIVRIAEGNAVIT